MNQNDVEKLILLFDGNKLPYSKLHQTMPCISDDDVLSLMGRLSSNTRLFTVSSNATTDDIRRHGFKPGDVFTLTEEGEDLFHVAQKDKHLTDLAEQSLSEAKKATLYAQLAILLSVVSIAISVLMG
ncbi:hypothetical protein [Megasphaera elsdenii]|uniref:Uncharacterized protein n=1 Tax=Megasphaera elsdenii TaxID=907 RepID=A0A2S0M9B8_MEGEL|nr:hypothetical protein [Megasphaera elsdenii]AVO28036.1 hypothetical protein C6Y28_10580 [Megasphaera elsdenii]